MTGGWGLGWPQGYKKLRLSVLGFRLVDFFPDPPSLAQVVGEGDRVVFSFYS